MPATCAKCGASLAHVSHLKADGKEWHEACFRCSECGGELGGTFFKVGTAYVCSPCQTGVASPPAASPGKKAIGSGSLPADARVSRTACTGCGKPITTSFFRDTQQRKYHGDCFKCFRCHKQIGANVDYYCDKFLMFQPCCTACYPTARAKITPIDKNFQTSGRWANRASGSDPATRYLKNA